MALGPEGTEQMRERTPVTAFSFFDFDLLDERIHETTSDADSSTSEKVLYISNQVDITLQGQCSAESSEQKANTIEKLQAETTVSIGSPQAEIHPTASGEQNNAPGNSLIGVWFYDCGQFSYEIGAAPSALACNGQSGLYYMETLSSGIFLKGLLRPSEEKEWNWEAQFDNGGCVRLRRSADAMISCYLPSGASAWEPWQQARRADAFAFYNANTHPEGHRYVLLVDRPTLSPYEFPLCGYTACWSPVMVIQETSTDTVVRFAGSFSDPFDVAPPACIRNTVNLAEILPAKGKARSTMQGQSLLPVVPSWKTMPGKAIQTKNIGLSSTSVRFSPTGKGKSKGKPLSSLPSYQVSSLSPMQQVAASLGCTAQDLWEKASFRGKLRKLPNKQLVLRNLKQKLRSSLIRSSSQMPPRPLLSILCVRWYDYWSDPQKSSDYSTLNDGFFTDLFDGPLSAGQLLPGQYEVFTVFVRSTKDIRKLDPHYLRSRLRGINVVAWYFIWPSFDQSAGFVSAQDFFEFLQAMERIPVRTTWPHESHLYRILCGKLWIPQMCLNRDYRVPPTTRLHYADFKHNGKKAIVNVLRNLMLIRKKVWGKEDVPLDEFKGVVKLGFSWGGFDVLPFKGIDALLSQCRKLFEQPKVENIVCLVQEMIPNVVGEHRIVCIYDKCQGIFRKEPVWMMSLKAVSSRLGKDAYAVEDFVLASSTVVPSADVAARFFAGDRVAQQSVESQASLLASKWLSWYQTESTVPPQCTRIDFLVAYTRRGRAEAWTCEVGECGASLCSVEVHGRNLAALNTAILNDDSGRFPMRLPTPLPRNSGWKS